MVFDSLIIESLITFVKLMCPVVIIFSLLLTIRPKTFASVEKSLAKEFGGKKKTVAILERENMVLQEILMKNNRIVGLLCFVLTIIILIRL